MEEIVSEPTIGTSYYKDRYASYAARYGDKALDFGDWLRSENLHEAYQSADAAERGPEPDLPTPGEREAPEPEELPSIGDEGISSDTSTVPGSIHYDRGNHVTIHNNPVFENHLENIGSHNGNNNGNPEINIGATALDGGSGRRIEVRDDDRERERPPKSPEDKEDSDEVAGLKKEVAELKEQLEGLKKQLEELVEQLKKKNDDEEKEDKEKKKDPLEEARKALEDARNNLLEITIRRRARMWDGHTNRGAADGEAYGPAMDAYKEQLANYLKVMRETLTGQELEEAEIRRKLTEAMYEERANFAREEVSRNNAELDKIAKGEGKGFFGKLFGKRANLLRWWANRSGWTKLGITAAVTAGMVFAPGGLAASAALLGAGSGFKFSLGLLSRRASLRNTSEKGLRRELKGIDAARAKALEALGLAPHEQELFDKGLIDHVQSDLDGRVQSAQRRNKFGNALMLLSLAAVGAEELGLAGLAISSHDIPIHKPGFFHLPGFLTHHNHTPSGTGPGGETIHGATVGTGPGGELAGSGSGIDLAHSGFNPNEFGGRAMNAHEVTRSMFDVFRHNGYHVGHISDSQINQIMSDMEKQHMHIAFGMDANGHQHLVDAAQGLAGSNTPNEYASGLAGLQRVNGSSVGAWQKVLDIAANRGVEITKG